MGAFTFGALLVIYILRNLFFSFFLGDTSPIEMDSLRRKQNILHKFIDELSVYMIDRDGISEYYDFPEEKTIIHDEKSIIHEEL